MTTKRICLTYFNLRRQASKTFEIGIKKVYRKGHRAGIAQLVEYKLPKLGVASSNLVARSNLSSPFPLGLLIWGGTVSVVSG